jgi:hypothetical protein
MDAITQGRKQRGRCENFFGPGRLNPAMSQGCFLEGQSSHFTPPSEKESLLNNHSSLTRIEGLNMATIILGAQWGDEGKGKLTDILSTTVKLCASTYSGSIFLPIRECLLSRHVLGATTPNSPPEDVIANSSFTKRSTRWKQRRTYHVRGSQNVYSKMSANKLAASPKAPFTISTCSHLDSSIPSAQILLGLELWFMCRHSSMS